MGVALSRVPPIDRVPSPVGRAGPARRPVGPMAAAGPQPAVAGAGAADRPAGRRPPADHLGTAAHRGYGTGRRRPDRMGQPAPCGDPAGRHPGVVLDSGVLSAQQLGRRVAPGAPAAGRSGSRCPRAPRRLQHPASDPDHARPDSAPGPGRGGAVGVALGLLRDAARCRSAVGGRNGPPPSDRHPDRTGAVGRCAG